MKLRREKKEGKYGCVDENGMWVIAPVYNWIKVRESELCVQLDDKWGFINPDGTNITPICFDNAEPFSEGYAAVRLNGKEGFINRNGDFLSEPIFDHVGKFRDGIAVVVLSGKYGWIKSDGSFIVDPIYEETFNHGNAIMVKLNGKYGYVDLNGKELIPCRLDAPI